MVSSENFRRLSLDETIRKTFGIYCAGFKVLTALAAFIVVLDGLLWAICLVTVVPLLGVDGESFADPQYLLEHIGQFYAIMGIRMLASTVISALLMGSMIRAVIDVYLGVTPDLKACVSVGIKRTPTLLTVSVLGFCGVLLGCLFLIIPGYYLAIRWFFVTQIVVVEGLGAIASFKRSWTLSKGSWCYIFCTFLIFYIFLIILQLVWGTVVVGGSDVNSSMLSLWGSILSIMPAIFFVPIMSIVMTLMYLNMRIEKEGLNEHVLLRDLGASGAVDASYSPLVESGANAESTPTSQEPYSDHVDQEVV